MGGVRWLKKLDDNTVMEYIENWSVEPNRIRIKVFKLKEDFGDQEL